MEATATSVINLRKEKVINLKKQLGIEMQKAQVVLCLDYSGSMRSLYSNGSVQELAERLLPLGLAFDDNGEVDFYIFENGYKKLPENITLQNVNGYIKNKVMGKYSMGGTSYAPIIESVVSDFSNKKKGLFKSGYEQMDLPVYVIFITDGENDDRAKAEQAIKEASKAGIFFQFVGIGDASFDFLTKLDTMDGRFIDNANFFQVKDLNKKSDDELYSLLLNEFPSYVTEARSKGLIK